MQGILIRYHNMRRHCTTKQLLAAKDNIDAIPKPIIDRAEDGENTVHFLNQVNEADLLALMEEESAPATVRPWFVFVLINARRVR